MDSRIKKLADILVNHSLTVKKGDVIQINTSGLDAKPLVLELTKLILKKGALPRLHVGMPGFSYTFFKHASDDQLKVKPKISLFEAKNIDGIISIGADHNTKELTNVDPKKIALRKKTTHPISEIILKRDNWVICEYPTNALAQDAEMSLEEFEDFVFSACNVDYDKMSKEQDKLKALFDKADKVRVIGKDTDLTLSIKGRTSIKCCGHRNIPDGEVFLAPVDDSANGYISYSFPAIYAGREVSGIKLWFKDGKVVKFSAEKNEAFLKQMLETDAGAKRIGEFAIGLNFNIKNHIKQILFDEKIGGSIHIALGMAYKEGGGKNESALHWDMIKDLRPQAGGGEIYFDDKLIFKDGKLL